MSELKPEWVRIIGQSESSTEVEIFRPTKIFINGNELVIYKELKEKK